MIILMILAILLIKMVTLIIVIVILLIMKDVITNDKIIALDYIVDKIEYIIAILNSIY